LSRKGEETEDFCVDSSDFSLMNYVLEIVKTYGRDVFSPLSPMLSLSRITLILLMSIRVMVIITVRMMVKAVEEQ